MKHIHGGNVYQNIGMMDFSANINFLGMPENVKNAAFRGIEESLHYPEPESSSLSKLLAEYYDISYENVLIGNGAAEVIYTLVNSLKPKKALLMAPSFYEYEQALKNVDCEIDRYILSNSLNQSGKFRAFCVLENILEMITEKTDIVFICNPNNPTGNVTSKTLLNKVMEKCEKVGSTLVVDESFLDFVENYEELTMSNEIISHKKLVVIKSFTKLFAMPGIRLGFGMSSDKCLVSRMKESLQPWNVSLSAQLAGMAAIEEMKNHLFVEATRKAVKLQREYLMREIADIGFEVYESAANFILLKGNAGLVEHCNDNCILIRDCSNFEGLREGWYRVAVRSSDENKKLIEVMRCFADKV